MLFISAIGADAELNKAIVFTQKKIHYHSMNKLLNWRLETPIVRCWLLKLNGMEVKLISQKFTNRNSNKSDNIKNWMPL